MLFCCAATCVCCRGGRVPESLDVTFCRGDLVFIKLMEHGVFYLFFLIIFMTFFRVRENAKRTLRLEKKQ